MQCQPASSYTREAVWSSPPASRSLHRRRHTPSRSRAPSSQSAPRSRTLRFQAATNQTHAHGRCAAIALWCFSTISHSQAAVRMPTSASFVYRACTHVSEHDKTHTCSGKGLGCQAPASASGSTRRGLQAGCWKKPTSTYLLLNPSLVGRCVPRYAAWRHRHLSAKDFAGGGPQHTTREPPVHTSHCVQQQSSRHKSSPRLAFVGGCKPGNAKGCERQGDVEQADRLVRSALFSFRVKFYLGFWAHVGGRAPGMPKGATGRMISNRLTGGSAARSACARARLSSSTFFLYSGSVSYLPAPPDLLRAFLECAAEH